MSDTVISTVSGTPDRPYDAEDLSSRAFWSMTMDEREQTFARLRERGTLTWHPPFEDSLLDDPDDHGFWAVTTYDDLVEVTRRPGDFLSGPGILMESLPDALVRAGQSIVAMDPPRHTKMRKLVSAAFTPRQMHRITARIEANAGLAVDNLLQTAEANGGTCDFVAECAELLPMHNINDMMGVPDRDRAEASWRIKLALAWNDDELTGTTKQEKIATASESFAYTHGLAASLAGVRRAHPGDDLITALAQAEVDGEQLDDFDIGSFFTLLTIAGNDTTRQSISHGLRALTVHPEQRAWLLADLPARTPVAIEELVRWATPVVAFRRTAARELELRGQTITAGDKVVLFYSSANRDASAIERPHELDLSRDPNPHVGFGGGGIHHCLGNQLARRQLTALFVELLRRAPEITAGEPERMPSNIFNAVKRMPCHV